MQQDLGFQNIRNANPLVLTSAQIDSYNLDGFISPLDLFSNVEAEANRAYLDSLLQQVPKSGAYSINC